MNPTGRCVVLVCVGLGFAAMPLFFPASSWIAWGVFVVLSTVAIALDGFLALRPEQLRVRAVAPAAIFIGESDVLRADLQHEGTRTPKRLEARLEIDQVLGTARAIKPTESQGASLSWSITPLRRGRARWHGLHLRWEGPLGLMRWTRRVAIDEAIDVTPNIRAAQRTALRFFSSRNAQHGLKTEQFTGEGSEFESLWLFRAGLDSRSIDWKASARHRKLLARRFRAERNHQVVLAVDTGHLMREPIEGLPRIDHAVTRALALAYFCLRTGDRVGMYGFGAEPGFYLAPQGGTKTFARLQRQSAAIEYGKDETNFTLGMLELTRRLRRRSLVLVFTEFVDTVTAELMVQNLDRLAKRHVVIFVAMRDPELEDLELRAPQRLSDVSRTVVASGIRRDRERVLRSLERKGIHVLDCTPKTLTLELINRYIAIKRRELV